MRLKQPPKYDRRCRGLSPGERHELDARGIRPVARFKTPRAGAGGDSLFRLEIPPLLSGIGLGQGFRRRRQRSLMGC
jgi:hypothetical protein